MMGESRGIEQSATFLGADTVKLFKQFLRENFERYMIEKVNSTLRVYKNKSLSLNFVHNQQDLLWQRKPKK